MVDSIYFILDGYCEVIKQNEEVGRRELHVVANLNAGMSIGLGASGFFARNKKRTATIICRSDARLLRFDAESIEHFLQTHQQQASDIIINKPVITPTYLQMESTECGVVCLQIILAYHGCYESSEKLREICAVSRNGVDIDRLIKVAELYGLSRKSSDCS